MVSLAVVSKPEELRLLQPLPPPGMAQIYPKDLPQREKGRIYALNVCYKQLALHRQSLLACSLCPLSQRCYGIVCFGTLRAQIKASQELYRHMTLLSSSAHATRAVKKWHTVILL